MLKEWIAAAKADRPVWISDVREALSGDPGAVPCTLRLRLRSGAERDFAVPLPRWADEDGRRFAADYLCANVFNALSALSARRVELYVPEGEAQALSLARELPEAFQLSAEKRSGYGKTVSVANRMNRAFGAPELSIEIIDGAPQSAAAPIPEAPAADLAERLRRAAESAGSGLFCGVDIGGSDIKLALSRGGALAEVRELNWNPALSPTAEGIIDPILNLIRESAGGEALDGLGVSFPDVVIHDRVVGGESPKTKGMRENLALDYEAEFSKLSNLKDALRPLCRDGAPIHITNDGHMAAFTAAMELACGSQDGLIRGGVVAHSIGTDLGTGWLTADGAIPDIPLELYDFQLDLGSYGARALPPEDLRSVRNENSGLVGVRRYVGQSAAFRLAYSLAPELVEPFLAPGPTPRVQEAPEDLRKPCLEHIMQRSRLGDAAAQEVFRQIGRSFAEASRELEFFLRPAPTLRFMFGRFIKDETCFALLQEGCGEILPRLSLAAADDGLANSPLMRQLAASGDVTVAQYGQAIGSIYFSLFGGA